MSSYEAETQVEFFRAEELVLGVVRLAFFFGSVVTGCAMQTEDYQGDEADQRQLEIENGGVPTTVPRRGVVKLLIPGADGTSVRLCSGQVVSRDTILTAAHCIYNLGYYANGWGESVNVPISAGIQNADLTFRDLLPSGQANPFTVSAFVQSAYVTEKRNNTTKQRGLDVALLRASNSFRNVTSVDTGGMPIHTSDRNSYLRLCGYGDTSDGGNNGWLYTGWFGNLTWYTSSSDSYYRAVIATYGANDAHMCEGDSGGPLKASGPDTSFSGVVLAVHSGGAGMGTCKENDAKNAMLSYHDIGQRA